jgi:hypothetical protein
MKTTATIVLTLFLATQVLAAPADEAEGAGGANSAPKSTSSKLEQALEIQQQQIQQLRDELRSRDQAMQKLQQQVNDLMANQPKPAPAPVPVDLSKQDAAIDSLRADVNDLKSNATNTALTLQETQKNISALESPLAINYKGVKITPGGFLAAETVWRSRALGSDINTPLNSVTMPGATQSKMGEFFASGRQSRAAALIEGKLSSATLRGYYEADFLSAGVTSNNNESNSYTFRQRQLFAQAAMSSGWTFTGGQMWSLVTETKKGLDNRSEALPMTIDPQYTVGFSWARQYGFRATKNFHNHMWVGASVENSQETLTVHGNASPNNFVVGSAGTGGGLYNPSATYSFNPSPDFVFKAAFEPGFGHYEVFGLVSPFRDRIFPCATATSKQVCDGVTGPSAAGASNTSATGWGFGGNGRITLAKQFDLGLHFLGGNGVGRYGTSTLPDATVRPDGTLSLLQSYQSLGTFEWHLPKFDLYTNVGGEYVSKAWEFDPVSGKAVGYGSPYFKNSGCYSETPPGTPTAGQFPTSSTGFVPGSLANCTGDTRFLIEASFGLWFKVYNGPKGRIQFGPQYSYLTRNTWSGTYGEPHGVENMFFTSFRYYLP